MSNIKLKAVKKGKEKLAQIKKEGFIPAVVYGNKDLIKEAFSVKVKKNDFLHVFAETGRYKLIDLEVESSEPLVVLVKEIQKDTVNNDVLHADFYCVNMNERVVTEIPINLIGESSAIKNSGGILVKQQDALKIKCLPGDLADRIEVDISALENINDNIKAKDLKLPKNLELAGDWTKVIVNVTRSKKAAVKEVKAEDKKVAKKEEKK